MNNRLVLIDGNSIAYRAFFALPLLSNDKGVYTNAVYGFTTMLLKVLENHNPSHMLVAFDKGKKTFRHETYASYKGTRQKTPSELSEQLPMLHDLLASFDIAVDQQDLYEADDLIGTYARLAEAEGYDIDIITGDKDLLQLVSEKITVHLTRKGITEMDSYDIEALYERYALQPEQIIDLKALMGDSSDNIPGVPGVGEKTALKLLAQFSTVAGVYDHLDEVSGKKLKEKLADHRSDAEMSRKLVTINTDAPINKALKELSYASFEPNKVGEVFKEFGFKSLLERIGSEEAEEESSQSDIDVEVELLTADVKKAALQSPAAIVIELPQENYHTSPILGMGIANDNGVFFASPEVIEGSKELQDWLASDDEKVVYHAKKAWVSLKWKGLSLNGVTFDAYMASYLINPGETNHELSDVASRHAVGKVRTDESIYGKGAKFTVPPVDTLAQFVGEKAVVLRELHPLLAKELKARDMDMLFEELEFPLAAILSQMEFQGVDVNAESLKSMGQELEKTLAKVEAEIHELADVEFNINSPKQLGEILFDKLNLPVMKKTKTGYSTSADVLEKLEDKHPIIEKILLYRQLGKLNSTYIEGLLKSISDKTGKIHTRFNQALTQTGRLSSIDPNLQNIPIRLEEGRKIRKAFVPSEPDWVLLSADYSQIELRVLAHISEDEKLIEAFKKGEDIHTQTAMEVFKVEADDVTGNMRRQAKAVNFGIVYGISDYGLSQSLGITRKEAGQFIERYLESYPGVKRYMESVVEQARKDGYVTTLMNRRRYLPDINSRQFNQRSFAERTAMNTPIQGTGADIIKQAMIRLNDELKKKGARARVLLQVHDELIIETPKEELAWLETIVPSVMEQAMALDVPLKVDLSSGSTWYDAK
ncbi:DNA polymerase I [Aureibacillus halotolerans]|uniref:DNA polymerase I n=1 Tax=Aureibacillus halotolerans TaxID=1508390 RepID=A0A4R6TYV9_9BACI|nr:DNA polymerase I [Aureibacillus halotolerans]TDQ39148.1 DNA polymerase I [Aureibacillus halotolerans]